eukprot:4804751-Lingulodinium_polyedra.AAC.1
MAGSSTWQRAWAGHGSCMSCRFTARARARVRPTPTWGLWSRPLRGSVAWAMSPPSSLATSMSASTRTALRGS